MGPATTKLGTGLALSPTPLVGRRRELGALGSLLRDADVRLITLTGPPGVGKTRLAVAAAAAVEDAYPDGVLVVDLTAVRDPDLVAAEISGALGRDAGPRPVHDLPRTLAGRRVLLVLDNFEHVLPAASQVGELLAACPLATVLVTSRERLRLRAERELPLLPLALPGPSDRISPERVATSPAVALLVQQVQAFDPAFTVSGANAQVLAEICSRLDGLPLALELAAAGLRLFLPGELLSRLRDRVGLLASDARDVPERHRTLSAALAWSHDLLAPEEQAVFRRLSVFVGGWTLEAAAAVCGIDDAVATTASLVDKSLIRRVPGRGTTTRFTMLESLREFAAEQLQRAGDAEATRARHADFFARSAAELERRVGTRDERSSIEDVGLDVGNFRAAAHLLASARPGLALAPATAVGWYSYTRGRLGSAQAELEEAIAAAKDDPETSDEVLAAALLLVGVIALGRGRVEDAEGALRRGLGIADRIGSVRQRAIGEAFLGHTARARGHATDAVAHHQEAGRLHEQLGNVAGVAWSRYDLGLLARRRRDSAAAARFLRESLRSFRELGYEWAIGCAAQALATVELSRRHLEEAAALAGEALACFEATDDHRGVAQGLETSAGVALDRGDPGAAGVLLGAAAGMRDRIAAPPAPEEEGLRAGVAARLRDALPDDDAEEAERAGRALATSSALALARRLLHGPPPASPPEPVGPLTPREQQVAVLIRQGRTNRQIGRELGIAEKTAEVHVGNIIRKLGASGRAEVAARVAAAGAARRTGSYGDPPIPQQRGRP